MTTLNKILKALLYCVIGFCAVVGASGILSGIKEMIIEKHEKKKLESLNNDYSKYSKEN